MATVTMHVVCVVVCTQAKSHTCRHVCDHYHTKPVSCVCVCGSVIVFTRFTEHAVYEYD